MTVRVRVGGLAFGGAFVGQIFEGPIDAVGKKAFIPFVAPGEVVDANVEIDEKRFCVAGISNIVEPSPDRIQPKCKYFADCGGCHLQHLPIAIQRELKRSMVETSLKTHGNILPINGVNDSSSALPDYEYRRRITLHLDASGAIGFYRASSNQVVEIDTCVISSSRINASLPLLHAHAQTLCAVFSEVILEEFGNGVAAQFVAHETVAELSAVPKEIHDAFAQVSLSNQTPDFEGPENADGNEDSTVGHFSQINAAANEVLVKTVLEWVSTDKVTDLYAGSGNFSLPLAALGKQVNAVELDSTLAVFGMKTAIERSLDENIKFFAASCEHYLRKNKLASSVVLDPPRAGAKSVLQHITPARTFEVIYVSCSLPTLTRDLKTLVANGYTVIETRCVDMFAQTHHIETVTLLRAL